MFQKLRRWAKARLFSRLRLGWETASGYKVPVDRLEEWLVFCDLFVDGEYDAAIQATLATLRETEPATILDLGANVGYFALRFMDRFRRAGAKCSRLRLVLVEGSPTVFPILRQRTAQLSAPGLEISLHQGLAGERSGQAHFQQSQSHLASHVAGDGKGVKVDYLDLDALVPAGPIALLKCDIEGSEDAFLRNYGALLARTERAVFEFHHHVRPFEEFIAATCAHGFAPPQCLRKMPDYSTWFFERSRPVSA